MVELSGEQTSVFEGVGAGLSNAGINGLTGIHPARIDTIVREIQQALGVDTRWKLILAYIDLHVEPTSSAALRAQEIIGNLKTPDQQLFLSILVVAAARGKTASLKDLFQHIEEYRGQLEELALQNGVRSGHLIVLDHLKTAYTLRHAITHIAQGIKGLSHYPEAAWYQLARLQMLATLAACYTPAGE